MTRLVVTGVRASYGSTEVLHGVAACSAAPRSLAVDTWGTYAEYQKKTEREIPVFKLTPVD